MNNEKKFFRVVVLEDSEFFNNMLTRQLEHYTAMLAMEKKCRFEIQSYTSSNDFLRNLKNDTDVAFLDYYLGNGITASEILTKIQEKCWNCKVIIISQVKNLKTSSMALKEGVLDFIFKDINALPKLCFILEDIVDAGLSRNKIN